MGEQKKSVAGIALEDGKFFIAQRMPGGDMGEKWEFPGGKVEPGETDEAALRREYEEEFGVPITVGRLLGHADFEHRGIQRIVNAYAVSFQDHNFRLSEHLAWAWASLEEITELDFAGSDTKLLPALRRFIAEKA
ncbi:(deoxy)nucleoside triphosphate pyrophosphohydrolase [Breznakiella homolactica]|uniref:8-oxo-dGTP diphosphatase n=1 Tax=Breznakiella homolactica TaxID=2798577 RepID=A0A7T7XKT0_9SPIR|nr:NUDIX domain-containing protein [Breznakiella homolactica]QQO08063.1 NUDIX domain-containing protein [Breznakiella homolactica]